MKGKSLRVITEVLAIIVICLISFIGIYKQEYNTMQNQVKGYELEKDLSGYRELVFSVSDETESDETESDETTESDESEEEDLTEENYKKAKSIIETRLESLGVEDYNIALNTEDGTIYLQIPEDDTTDHTVSNILEVSHFEIRDSEDSSQVYLTNDDIKTVSAVYNTTTSGTTVYLQIEFNKQGTKTLKEISSGDYATIEEEETEDEEESSEEETTEDESAVEAEAEVSTEDTTTEEDSEETTEENTETTDESTEEESEEETTDESSDEEEEEEETQKEITLLIDDTEMITTSFDTPIEDGIIDMSMGSESTDTDTITDTLNSTSTIALLLNSGEMPLTYTVTVNNYVEETSISQEAMQKAIIVVSIIAIIAAAILVIKYKLRGMKAVYAYLGFVAIDLLLIRYTNVSISLESMVAAIIVLFINYLITYRLLNIKETDIELKKTAYSNEFKYIMLILLPIFIISIVFTFIEWTKIATFGMFTFWGILLSVVYNYVITKDMVD